MREIRAQTPDSFFSESSDPSRRPHPFLARPWPPELEGDLDDAALEKLLYTQAAPTDRFRATLRRYSCRLDKMPSAVLRCIFDAAVRHTQRDPSWTPAQLAHKLSAYALHDEPPRESTEQSHQASPSDIPAQQQQAPAPPADAHSFRSWMKNSMAGISKALGALGDTMQYLAAREHGATFSTEQHHQLQGIVACAHAHLTGLIPAFQLMNDVYQDCRASQVPQQAARNKGGKHGEAAPQQSYAQVARSGMTPADTRAPEHVTPSPTPRQQQRIAQMRALRRTEQEIKAKIRCDDRSFQLKPVTLKGPRPSFRQLGISLARTLVIPHLKTIVEDIRSDRGGRFYVQIRADCRKEFETALDRALVRGQAKWNLELDDLGTFDVSDPYESLSKGKIPVVIGNVDEEISADAALASIAEQNASRWQLPAAELLDTHMVAPHRMNRRKRDDAGNPTPNWIPSRNIKVFISPDLHQKLFATHAAAYASLDYMVLPIRAYTSPSRPRFGAPT